MANDLPPGSMPPPVTGGTPPVVNPPPPPPPPGPGTPPGGPVIMVGPGPAPPTANTPPSTATDVTAAANNVVEGAAVNTLVGVTARSTDAEGQTITYTLASDSSGGGFKIDAATGVVTVADPAKINFETAAGHAYTITVNSFDGFSTSSQSFTINVTDIAPSTPVDSNAGANTVAEGAAANTLVGITASSTDVNGPGVTYSLSNSANGAFKIDAATGVVSVADPSKIDFESTAPGHTLNITAVASDGTLSSSQNFAINVTDVALATPVDGNGAANSVAEGAANGSTVGLTAIAADPNGPATTYSLIGDTSAGGFTINATTGVVTIADATKVDFETSGGSYSVTVQAANGVSTTTQSFTIGVTDVAPATPNDTNGAADTVLEGVANGTAVGITAASFDPNGPATTFSLTDSAGGRFAIDANTGIVTVANGAAIDFETAPGNAYGITVQATSGALSSTQNFSIGVGNVNEAPAGTDKAVSIAEDNPYVFSVADFGFSDPSDSAAPNALLAVTMTTVPGAGAGTLTNNGVTVNAGDSVSVAAIAAGFLVFTPVLNSNGSPLATFTFQVQDNGGTANSGVDLDQSANTITIDVTSVNDAPAGTDKTISSIGAHTFAAADFGFTDPVDAANAGGANALQAVIITTIPAAGTGTLDLNGVAVTAGQSIAVADIGGLVFTPVGNNVATFTFQVQDNGGLANSGVDTDQSPNNFTITQNVAPIVTAGDTLNYTENATSVVDPTITITDPDNANMTGARVAISGGFDNTQDVLNFTPVGAITGSYNPVTGVLTLSGTDTQANYELALESVTYQNTSDNPTTVQRTLSYTVNDGSVDSAAATATINVPAVNDAPVITPTGGSTAYVENAAAVTIDGALTVTDPDSQIVSAQVRVSANFQAGDSLNFVDQNGITGVYTAGTGVLALSGTATVADYQAALRSITFSSTSDDPGVSKTIEFKVNDTVVDSNLATKTLAITPVNDEPSLTTSGLNPGFTENGAAVDLFSTPVVASAIEAGQNLNSLVVNVSNVAGATDSLTIDGTIVELNNGNSEITATNGMTASVVLAGGTATVTISKAGGVSAAIMQSIVDGLAYGNISEDPGAATRVVTLTSLSDTGPTGGANDNTAAFGIASSVAVTPVYDAPVIDLVAGGGIDNTATTATFSEGAGPPSTTVFALPNLDLNDLDSANLTGATVTVTDFVGGQDVLTVSGNTSGSIGGVSYSVSGNVITFSGTATVAAYEAAIQAVQYNNSSENPAPGARHFDIQVTDGNDASVTATATLNVVGQDDAPVNTIPADNAVPTAFSNTDTAISGISIADVDAGSGLVTTQLSVTNGTVAVTLAGGATISSGANGTATLTLSGTAADINATLANNVTFHSTDGFAGQANLTVVTNDGGNSGLGGPLTDTDVVHIGVVPQVWFIDNTNFAANGAGGTGTSADPFRSVADFNNSVGPGANDYIVVRTGTGTYTGEGLDLQNGQQVWGAGETLSFTNPVNGNVVNIPNAGTRPTIDVIGGDQGIDLASNNTIRNLNITTASGTSGIDDGNNDVGTLVIRNMDISGAGQAVDIDQGGTLDVQLGTVSSSGGTHGIQLAGTAAAGTGLLSGSFSATGGTISGATTAGFMVGNGAGGASTGGTAVISYGGSITASNAASVVNIQDHATGAVTLTGNLTHNGSSGAGIVLDDNSSNFTFSGANLNLNTGTSNAINITDQTGGTTVAFSGTVNIDTTSGTGVNFAGTSAANVNFTGGNLTIDTTGGQGFVANATTNATVNVTGSGNHINSSTGTALNITSTTIGASNVTFQDVSSNGAVNGIVLNTTGSSGHLVVTGTGTTDGTGGTIQNTTGHAISLTNTQDVTLRNMNITGADGNGINGNTINGLVLSNLNISGSGDSTAGNGEGNIYLFELTGNASHATTFDDLNVTNSYVHNVFIENTGGTLTDLVVTDSTFSNNGASTVAGSEFVINLATGGVAGTPTATVHATHNTFSGNLSSPATFTATGFQGSSNDGTLNVHLGDGTAGGLNTFDTNNSGITLSSALAGNINFDVNNNLVTHNRAVGIAVNHFGTGTVTGFLRNNTVGTQGEAGSGAQIGNGLDLHDEAASGTMTLSVTNNIIQSVGGGGLGFEGINAQVGVGAQNSASTFNLTLTGNTIRDIIDDRGLFVNNFNTAGLSVINANISGNTFSNANASGANTTARVGGAPGGSDHVNVTQASAAALAAANGLTASGAPGNTMRVDTNVFFSQPAPPSPPPTPQMALNGQGPGSSDVLTMDALAPLLAVAIAQWAAAGASAAQIEQMQNAQIRIADLPNSGFLANSDEHGITIDSNGAGWGWFVDPTPANNSEFDTVTAPNLLTATSGSAAGRIDLLTVIEHELGHVIGLEHSDIAGLMNVVLDTGERRLPDTIDVALAPTTTLTPTISLGPVTPTVSMGPAANAGNDTIDAGTGGGFLFGGGGADNFVFAHVDVHAAAPPPVTHVGDYSYAEGDRFDFSALTSQFHATGFSDGMIVRAVEDGSGQFATLQVNANDPYGPPAAANWVSVAQIDGAHSGDALNVLIDSHSGVHLTQLHVGLLV
ncbi:cadherin domain-containing protein [Bradyrhizobium sp. AUGA SZCCT0431]|uniref:cadherin domain-containing protein n=1 Tax=Bradyrhizobium sp. AUGA SZCCT0431 TaxID=2807674 RepID=UPI001BA877B0|nr:cadherin domain-containing protein [Bradyrhizobium sp. AUGA SZCCT0431]MBR1143456.1 cadherin domain-containing protein [Bradyrhizobium sp. AUGA SZCCT0431]